MKVSRERMVTEALRRIKEMEDWEGEVLFDNNL